METLVVDNPYTGEPACSLPLADEAAIGRVLDAAQKAARAWAGTSVSERKALRERAVSNMIDATDSIALEISQMMGKPLKQARGEVGGMAGRAKHMIAIAEEALADVRLPKDGFERRIVKAPPGVVLDLRRGTTRS
ncbi:MAG: aldehyde dehydrogenase family protein [Polyangiaceae bacterium]